ncbi:MAG: Gfo/Idh/MocA family protein, partial [Planctomycetota bacterium]
MDLSPEEKAVGRENFYVALGSKLTERKFLLEGIKQEIASERGLGPYYFGYGTSVPNPVRVGIIGTGDEGNVLIGACNPNYVTVAAIADIRPYNVHRAFHGQYRSKDGEVELVGVRPGLMRRYG